MASDTRSKIHALRHIGWASQERVPAASFLFRYQFLILSRTSPPWTRCIFFSRTASSHLPLDLVIFHNVQRLQKTSVWFSRPTKHISSLAGKRGSPKGDPTMTLKSHFYVTCTLLLGDLKVTLCAFPFCVFPLLRLPFCGPVISHDP